MFWYMGPGTIGLLSGLVSKILGAKKVIVLDLNDERLQTVKNVGIDYVINPKTEDVPIVLKI
jgi:threonine dehydrogenase-like Zn-dependent dehydrogenase